MNMTYLSWLIFKRSTWYKQVSPTFNKKILFLNRKCFARHAYSISLTLRSTCTLWLPMPKQVYHRTTCPGVLTVDLSLKKATVNANNIYWEYYMSCCLCALVCGGGSVCVYVAIAACHASPNHYNLPPPHQYFVEPVLIVALTHSKQQLWKTS